jgi:hypothetical protein
MTEIPRSERSPGSDEQTVIGAPENPRAGWDEAFREMRALGDDELLDGDRSTSPWDDEEWEWGVNDSTST